MRGPVQARLGGGLVAKRVLPEYQEIRKMLDEGMTKQDIADRYDVLVSGVIHALHRGRAKFGREEDETIPGFVKYWEEKGLNIEQIIDKIRPVRGW